MLRDFLVLLFVTCCALVPWVVPPPDRWLAWLSSHALASRAARQPPQPVVRYVYVRRISRGS
jgi:hypothetical protein